MCRLFTFCQCFFNRDTRKFMARCTFCASSSSFIFTCPTATFKQRTFFIWNLMVDFRSTTLASMSSEWVIRVGNLPA